MAYAKPWLFTSYEVHQAQNGYSISIPIRVVMVEEKTEEVGEPTYEICHPGSEGDCIYTDEER